MPELWIERTKCGWCVLGDEIGLNSLVMWSARNGRVVEQNCKLTELILAYQISRHYNYLSFFPIASRLMKSFNVLAECVKSLWSCKSTTGGFRVFGSITNVHEETS